MKFSAPFVFRLSCFFALAALPSLSFADSKANSFNASRAHHAQCGTHKVPLAESEHVTQVAREVEIMSGRLAQLAGHADIDTLATRGTVVIPVVFHVLAQGHGILSGEVPVTKLLEQIDVLNRAYRGAEGGASSGFQFELQDVTYSYNPAWATMGYGSRAETEAKSALRQGDSRTLNVYLADLSDDLLGWSTFPWEYARKPLLDGVVINYHTLPEVDSGAFSEGDTLVHEAGHWFGLLHTFEGGCSGKGDSVSDTAAERYPALGCPARRDTCKNKSGTDAVHNFMNYVDDACMTEFSRGQAKRMYSLMVAYR